jgi:hypothetical protein
MLGYRIVEVRNGKIMSLFHGTNGSREIIPDVWNVCDSKTVRDGSGKKFYLSGWHFLSSRDDCENFFMKMFRIKENRIVVPCEVRGDIRPKHPDGKGKPCLLANEILIKSEDIKKCLN